MHREILPMLMIVLMFALAAYSGPMVSTNSLGQIISYWGGTTGGMINKAVGIYLLPVLTLVFYLAFLLIPRIEVYKKNLDDFAQQFWGFRVVFIFVMCAIYVATLIPNYGFWRNFDPIVVIIPAISLMFFYVGYMLNFTKRNFFIGVGTPWTLASEEVWDKTNRFASKLFWALGVLTFVSFLAPGDSRLWFVLLPLIAIVLIAYVYSYMEYRKIQRGHYRVEAPAKKISKASKRKRK